MSTTNSYQPKVLEKISDICAEVGSGVTVVVLINLIFNLTNDYVSSLVAIMMAISLWYTSIQLLKYTN